jgi:ribosomal protein L12E/L44/L45/RPP1/RPP2
MARLKTGVIPMILALLFVVAAACGSDETGDGSDNAAQDAGQAEEEPAEEEPTPEKTGPPTITADEFSYQLPESLPAGEATFKFENVGEQKHIAVFVELLKGKTLDDVNAFIAANGVGGKTPSWVRPLRKPTGFAKPGDTTKFSGEFTPGDYAVLCFIRDPKSKKVHAELGMTAALTFE